MCGRMRVTKPERNREISTMGVILVGFVVKLDTMIAELREELYGLAVNSRAADVLRNEIENLEQASADMDSAKDNLDEAL